MELGPNPKYRIEEEVQAVLTVHNVLQIERLQRHLHARSRTQAVVQPLRLV